MKIYLLPIIIVFVLSACQGNTAQDKTQKEYDRIKQELEDCKKEVEALSNTPQMRLNKAFNFLKESKINDAKIEFQQIIEKYPVSEEAVNARHELDKIEAEEKIKNDEAERKKTLGFKALNENLSAKVGQVTLKFNAVSVVSKWTFDDYGNEYMLRQAERGQKYINAKVSITSVTKNPKLPPICIYKLSNGELVRLGTMAYEFAKWEDYGSYLGNYADYGNDFAHTETIAFSCGFQVAESTLEDNAVFVVVKNTNCFNRESNSIGNPAVNYIESNCETKYLLNVDDFDEDYSLIKIFNKNKL